MSTTTSPLPAPVRRRKLRKDTHSCWECKRRKMRCVYEPAINAAVCHGCMRRGSACISQDLGNMPPRAKPTAPLPTGPRHARAGSSVDYNSDQAMPGPDKPLTPSSMILETSRSGPLVSNRSDSLSRLLYNALPSAEDTERIFAALPSQQTVPHEIMTMPYTSLEPDQRMSRPERQPPTADAHPVLIARHMLFLASVLQHLHPDVHLGIKDLTQTPENMATRLADLAITHVTADDKLLGSMEGLTCIMMESVYHANGGNLRRSWIAARRAITVAQLMGLSNRGARSQPQILQSGVHYDSKVIWSRMVFLDRFLCLLLGLPQACNDRSMNLDNLSKDNLHLTRLEHVHCMVAAGVIERNANSPDATDAAVTAALGLELLTAARDIPSRWWLVPDFTKTGKEDQSQVWEVGRLFAQVLHYNLLNQLYLPYMLYSNAVEGNDYALVTCTNASREVLTRFLALRSANGVTPSCRILDYLALMAAMTLLLAHLDCQHLGSGNLLAHQYCNDRAMVERVRDTYLQAGSALRTDPVSIESADLLNKLLDVDLGSFGRATGRVSLRKLEAATNTHTIKGIVRVPIPYFGMIQIARQYDQEVLPRESRGMQNDAGTHQCGEALHAQGNAGANSSPVTTESALEGAQVTAPLDEWTEEHHTGETLEYAADSVGSDPNDMPMGDVYHDFPGLAADTSDWALQGVDLAYFNNLTMYQGIVGVQ